MEWTYLALRDERLIGAGATAGDARRLCEDKAAEMHEHIGAWRVWPDWDGQGDPDGDCLRDVDGPYVIRRVSVARFGDAR